MTKPDLPQFSGFSSDLSHLFVEMSGQHLKMVTLKYISIFLSVLGSQRAHLKRLGDRGPRYRPPLDLPVTVILGAKVMFSRRAFYGTTQMIFPRITGQICIGSLKIYLIRFDDF